MELMSDSGVFNFETYVGRMKHVLASGLFFHLWNVQIKSIDRITSKVFRFTYTNKPPSVDFHTSVHVNDQPMNVFQVLADISFPGKIILSSSSGITAVDTVRQLHCVLHENIDVLE